jgi:hypothetical protein
MRIREKVRRRWRGFGIMFAGVIVGALLIEPALAHVTPNLTHLIGHLNPVYINTAELAGGDVSGPHGNLQLRAGSVGAAEVADNSVGSAELAADSVGSAEIADNAVGSGEIAADSVGSAEVADSSLGSAKVTDDSLGSADIANNSLSSADIGFNAVGSDELGIFVGPTATVVVHGGASFGQYDTELVIVSCPFGAEVFGVSIDWLGNEADEELFVSESRRLTPSQWLVTGGNNALIDRTLAVTPLCLGISS